MFNAINIVLAIIAISVACISPIIGWRWLRPGLRSCHDFRRILSSGDWMKRNMPIFFKGTPIRSLSRTYLALWNQRGSTCDGKDISKAEEKSLQIAVDNSETILTAKIVCCSSTAIGAAVDNQAPFGVHFQGLAPHDGFVIEIFHTGNRPATFKGEIIGSPIRRPFNCDLSDRARIAKSLPWYEFLAPNVLVFLISCMFVIVGATALDSERFINFDFVQIPWYDFSMVSHIICFLVPIIANIVSTIWKFALAMKRRYPRSLVREDIYVN